MKRSKQERRPSSDSFVDVHIFVVPHELWMDKYRTTYNNSTLESVSAGFVRVAPILSLSDLRSQIKEQLGGGDVIPEDYVFLRCVGRCLAIVSRAQEFSLKVKHFLPPVVSSPEIFVLLGTHEGLSGSLTSPINSGSDVPEYGRVYLTNSRERDEVSRCSTRRSGDTSPENFSKDDKSVKEGKESFDTGPLPRHVHLEEKSEGSATNYGYDKSKTNDDCKIKGDTKGDENQLGHGVSQKDDVENADVQRDRNVRATNLTQLPQAAARQQSVMASSWRRQESLQAPQNLVNFSENVKFQKERTDKEAVLGSLRQETGCTLGKGQITEDKKLSSDVEQNSSQNQSDKTERKNPLIHSKTVQALRQNSSNEASSQKDGDSLDRAETREGGTAEENNESLVLDSDGNKNNQIRNISTVKDGSISEKNNSNIIPRSTSPVNSTIASNELESLPTTNKTVDTQEKDVPLTLAEKENLVLQLQSELQAVRRERSNSERTREQLLKKAKNLQNQSNQRRAQARNIWKKRYFEEKKITVSLEERCNQLRYEVDVLHKRFLSSVDSKDHEATNGYVHHDGDPDKVSNKILLTRKENEVEELKCRVEETKIKLGSEMKLRDNAQKELKQLRDEVIDKKINATLVKKRLSVLETRPSNT